MQFPKYKDPSSVTKAPTAKTLTYNGSAQALVEAGEAFGGKMNYVIGTDEATAPTTGWSTSIPTRTDAGTYYVWYKVVGDSNHKACKVKVKPGKESTKATISKCGKKKLNTSDSVVYGVKVVTHTDYGSSPGMYVVLE